MIRCCFTVVILLIPFATAGVIRLPNNGTNLANVTNSIKIVNKRQADYNQNTDPSGPLAMSPQHQQQQPSPSRMMSSSNFQGGGGGTGYNPGPNQNGNFNGRAPFQNGPSPMSSNFNAPGQGSQQFQNQQDQSSMFNNQPARNQQMYEQQNMNQRMPMMQSQGSPQSGQQGFNSQQQFQQNGYNNNPSQFGPNNQQSRIPQGGQIPQSQNSGLNQTKTQLSRQAPNTVDDYDFTLSNQYNNLYLNQYPVVPQKSVQNWIPQKPPQGANQNWWNVDYESGYESPNQYPRPYQQNQPGPQPVYQENQPPGLQYFYPPKTTPVTLEPHSTTRRTPPPPNYPGAYNPDYNQNNYAPNPNQNGNFNPLFNNNYNNPNNYYNPMPNGNYNPSGYNPYNNYQPQNGNRPPFVPPPNGPMPNGSPQQNNQDYYAGLYNQFHRTTTTTDMPSISVGKVPDTYSKSFNPYLGMTLGPRPVTPQMFWYSRYVDLTAQIAALPWNNVKNMKKKK